MKNVLRALLIFLFSGIALSINAAPFNYYAQKAEECLNNGEFQDAYDYAAAEINDYPDNPNGYLQLSLALWALNEPGNALSTLNKAIEHAKKDKDIRVYCYNLKGKYLEKLDETSEAVKAYDEGLKIDPKNLDLLIARGIALTSLKPEDSLKDFQKAVKLYPDNPTGYFYVAYWYNSKNEFQKAFEEINKAISLDKTQSHSYALRGNIEKSLGMSPEWIEDSFTGIELDPEDNLSLLNFSNVPDEKDRKRIIEEFKKRMDVYPELGEKLAGLLEYWGEPEGAAEIYEEMIRKGDVTADIYCYLAQIQDSNGDKFKAYVTASKGLSVFPNETSLKYEKAKIGVEAGKAREVLPLVNALIIESPSTVGLYEIKGDAYMSLGEYDKAIEPYTLAEALMPTIKYNLLIGDALRLSGDKEKAEKYYSSIISTPAEGIDEQGFIPAFYYAMAYSGLGMGKETMKWLSELDQDAYYGAMPYMYARLGEDDKAMDALKSNKGNHVLPHLSILYDYNFHGLQKNPEFSEWLAENDIPTTVDKDSGLLVLKLEFQPETMGGTSYEEVMKLLTSNPQQWLIEINKLCPVDMGSAGQLIGVDLNEDKHEIIYNFRTPKDETYIDIYDIAPDSPEMEQRITVTALALVAQNPEIASMPDGNFKYNYVSFDGSKRNSLTLSANKLKEVSKMSENQEEVDKFMIQYWIDQENNLYAKNENTKGFSSEFKDGWYILTMPVANSEAFASVELFKDNVKDNLIKNLTKDMSMALKLPVVVRANVGLRYRLVDPSTGNNVYIDITPEELLEYMQ